MGARVLSVLVVLFFCVGCAECPNGYYQCEWTPASTSWFAAQQYVARSYPDQAAGLGSIDFGRRIDETRAAAIYYGGNWILEDAGGSVVITNTVTGVRWEGRWDGGR
jgi:hypothetical protein